MIKTTIIPKENVLHLPIPNNYVGKEVEVLLYTTEESTPQKPTPKSDMSRFKGLLTAEEAAQYHAHLKQARTEWERDI